MRVIIVAAGQAGEGQEWRRWVRAGDLVIGADGGAARALGWGLVPDLVVGDLDSLPETERAALEARGCEFVIHPRAKDETDLELALVQAVERGAQEIVVLGALGGRLDHTLANLLLLTLPRLAGVVVRIVAGGEEAILVHGGGALVLDGAPGDVVSLLPLGGDARGVTTAGLAWPLRGETLPFGYSRGVSNEMTAAAARVELEAGYLLAIHHAGPAPHQP
jgi:thiamine pyrophosphokinase